MIIQDGIDKPILKVKQSSTEDWFPNCVPAPEPGQLLEMHQGAFLSTQIPTEPLSIRIYGSLREQASGIGIFIKHPPHVILILLSGGEIWNYGKHQRRHENKPVNVDYCARYHVDNRHDPQYLE